MNIKRIGLLALNLMFFSNVALAGDRELVDVTPLDGFDNVIMYTKVHMDSVRLFLFPDGSRGFSFLKELHTVDTVKPELHTMNLDKVDVNMDNQMYSVTHIKTIDYTSGAEKYWNTSLGWTYVNSKVTFVKYVADNYDRYVERGTIGDKFRPNE